MAGVCTAIRLESLIVSDVRGGRFFIDHEVMMSWNAILLLIAIACETAATGLLKLSDGMSRFWPSIGMLVGYISSLLLLSIVLKTLPVGPVYAIWSGLGTATTALVGYWAFGDRLPPGAWAGLSCVIVGVVLLSVYLPRAD